MSTTYINSCIACTVQYNLHAVIMGDIPCHAACAESLPCSDSPAQSTMELFMWQHDIVGVQVAHYIMDCFDAPGALSAAL